MKKVTCGRNLSWTMIGVIAAAGHAGAQVDASTVETIRPVSAAPVIGLTPAGMPMLADAVDMGAFAARGGGVEAIVFDSMAVPVGPCDPCGSYFFTTPFVTQVIADDFSIDNQFAGTVYDGGRLVLETFGCGEDAPEELILLINFYDTATLDPTGKGDDGFDNDGDGVPDAPYDASTFVGGAVVTFSAPSSPGVVSLDFTGLRVLGVLMDFTDKNDDLRLDSTYEISILSSVEDTDDDGVIDEIAYFDRVSVLRAGTPLDLPATCYPGGLPSNTGSTTDGLWGKGRDVCQVPPAIAGWSDGGTGPNPGDAYDPLVDLKFLAPPEDACQSKLNWATQIAAFDLSGTNDRLCADVNNSTFVDGSDFFAWVVAFNTTPPTPTSTIACDVNNNQICDESDFFAWVNFFAQGQNGPLCPALP